MWTLDIKTINWFLALITKWLSYNYVNAGQYIFVTCHFTWNYNTVLLSLCHIQFYKMKLYYSYQECNAKVMLMPKMVPKYGNIIADKIGWKYALKYS